MKMFAILLNGAAYKESERKYIPLLMPSPILIKFNILGRLLTVSSHCPPLQNGENLLGVSMCTYTQNIFMSSYNNML